MSRLSALLYKSKWGPKKRYYRTLTRANPTAAEWREVWGKPGGERGMFCVDASWPDLLVEHKACANPLPPLAGRT